MDTIDTASLLGLQYCSVSDIACIKPPISLS